MQYITLPIHVQVGVRGALELSGQRKNLDDATREQKKPKVAKGWGVAARSRHAERQAFTVGVSVKTAPAPFSRTKASCFPSRRRRRTEKA